jgi:hypothetical protein
MIELKQLKDITLNKDNPRLFEQMEIDEIVKSLKKSPHMLWLKPIVLNSLSIVLAGNLRTTGAKAIFQLGTTERGKILKAFEENIQESDLSELHQKEAIKNAKTFLIDKLIPVVYANFLTKEQETEFLIKDNAHLGKWDIDALTDNFDLADILEWGVDESLWGEAKDFNDDEGQQNADDKDYSDKNREIDIDTLDETMQLKFVVSKDEYFDIQERLNVVCARQKVETKEAALFELLNFYERNNE